MPRLPAAERRARRHADAGPTLRRRKMDAAQPLRRDARLCPRGENPPQPLRRDARLCPRGENPLAVALPEPFRRNDACQLDAPPGDRPPLKTFAGRRRRGRRNNRSRQRARLQMGRRRTVAPRMPRRGRRRADGHIPRARREGGELGEAPARRKLRETRRIGRKNTAIDEVSRDAKIK